MKTPTDTTQRGEHMKTTTPQEMQNTGFLRFPQVQQRFPVSKSVWYDGIKSGLYPKPVKLSARTSAWRVSDIDALVEKVGGEA